MLPPDTVIATALSDWLSELAGLRETTLVEVRRVGRLWLARWGPGRPVRDIRGEELRSYLIDYRQGRAASTARQMVRYLKWAWGHFRRRGLLVGDAVADLPAIQVARTEPRALTAAEVERLLAHLAEPVRTMAVLALETGLRRRTLLELRWEWVDMGDGWMHLPAAAMKGDRPYHAPLSTRSMALLCAMGQCHPGRVFPFSRGTVERRVNAAILASGVSFRFHDLRRTFFTRARERGVPLEVAMALSDHRDVATALRHYRAVSPAELLRAVGRAETCTLLGS